MAFLQQRVELVIKERLDFGACGLGVVLPELRVAADLAQPQQRGEQVEAVFVELFLRGEEKGSVVVVGLNVAHLRLEAGVEQSLRGNGCQVSQVIAEIAQPANKLAQVPQTTAPLGAKLIGKVVELQVFEL